MPEAPSSKPPPRKLTVDSVDTLRSLDWLITDAGTQVRAEINEEVVTEYAEQMARGVEFPPLDVFHAGDVRDGKGYHAAFWLADGFHRAAAAKRAKVRVKVRVHKGTLKDAIKFALKANLTHGLRRTHADKRKVVEIALKEWPDLSSNEIGKICGVSHPTVETIRTELVKFTSSTTGNPNNSANQPSSSPPPRKGADGKVRKMPTKKQPAATSQAQPVLDETGLEVPAECLELWKRGKEEIQPLLSAISLVKRRVEKARDENDRLFISIDFTDSLEMLGQIYRNVRELKPYAVCSQCKGTCKGKDDVNCKTCHGHGFVGAFYWKDRVPPEVKQARPKFADEDETEDETEG